ncbi:4-(cytidine 5'-diphospho)-2-C-methyl-D-erythritol kinase [Denitratisoma sp. DHT3]|uniref:4-(cytidine 5'-diphospho)-2-C-methyl-D-erythritol kinase n=1 Tax=Denitratisoma sp. DHT3 TaxID=1981880 RepID=UPI0011984A12|nr:4-(cytidine 5'-diphospho)-2-C-methyl-D-erythritol kinase [Denitratisoma sp. DHT3]QDX82023.1 4-(cytidine 5'-diphospho)-2-C-methyl-D-erythritol kinase [Denitratisoma sp. DHT3]
MAATVNLAPDWRDAWPAPAKINLFLHVVGRRADGYHLLQTVFLFLDQADWLRFSPRGDGRIELAAPLPGVPAEQDLTVRAARALADATGCREGVTIAVDKRLPMGGGLGGGSSDAATTLIALNRLWRCGLSKARLEEIGLALGADVPIFIHGRSAFAEGVGERFTDVAPPAAWYLVLVPALAVPTADIFRAPDLRRDAPAIAPAAWRPGFGGNDLEAVACRLHPEVARHLDWLRHWQGAGGAARMSGSGACCFAEFATEAAARQAQAALPADMRGFVARGLQKHPLADLTA